MLKVGETNSKSLVIGGIYREHQQLGRWDNNDNRMERQRKQEWRWERIVTKWKAAGRNRKTIVVGDINLDQMRWVNPEQHLESMVERTQNEIETEEFVQMVTGFTRQWCHQADSLLDHCWVNCEQRVLKIYNVVRGNSDHNVVGLDVSVWDIKLGEQNTRRRSWKYFDRTRCLQTFTNTDWSDILTQTNVDVAASRLEERITDIMETEAPMKTVQMRTRYLKWISDNTKAEIIRRDITRDIAKVTDSELDWACYRSLRNSCTKLQRKDRAEFLSKTFSRLEKEKDGAKIYSTAK